MSDIKLAIQNADKEIAKAESNSFLAAKEAMSRRKTALTIEIEGIDKRCEIIRREFEELSERRENAMKVLRGIHAYEAEVSRPR